MSYKERYQQLIQEGRGRTALMQSAGVEHRVFRLFRILLAKHQNYLAWSIAFQTLQAAEVFLLALRYFLYLPPQSLDVLRILSSLSLIPILLSLQSRATLGSPLFAETLNRRGRARVIAAFAQALFCSMATISMLVFFDLIGLTRITVLSPNIYLAVLGSGLLTLPFDAVNTFYIYQRGSIGRAAPIRVSRLFGTVSYLLALGALWANLPFFYLVLKVLPRLALTTCLWWELKADADIPFFQLTWLRDREIVQSLKRVFKEMKFPLATYCLMEAGLFLVFLPLERLQPHLGLILYLVTRFYHLALNLGLKAEFLWVRTTYRHRLSGNRASLRRHFKQWIKLNSLQLVISLPFFAVFLLKRLSVAWLSASGEVLSDSMLAYLSGVMLALHRGMLSGAVSWTIGCAWNSRFLRRVSAVFVIEILLVSFFASPVIGSFSSDQAFGFFVFTECFLGLALFALLIPLYTTLFPIGQVSSNQISFRKLYLKLQENRSILIYAELWPGRRPVDLSALPKELAPHLVICLWGKRGFFLSFQEEFSAPVERWLDTHGGGIRVRRSALCIPNAVHDFEKDPVKDALSFCLGSESDTLASLLYSKAFEMPTHSKHFQSIKTQRKDAASALPPGAVLLSRDPNVGWDISKAGDPVIQEDVLAYLALCERAGEWLDPTFSRRLRFRGIVNFHQEINRPAIVYFPVDQRTRLPAFEMAAFHHNFDLLLKEGGPA